MMKFTVRAFVLTLALAGAAATTIKASTPATAKVAMTEPGSPAPLCLPSSGSHCGMD